MRNISVVMLTVALVVLTAACTKESNTSSASAQPSVEQSVSADEMTTTTLTGVAVGGAHASIELEDEKGEVHPFEYPDLDRDSFDTWQEGDTMVVTYVHNPNPAIGDSVISLHQKNAANRD